ncbi:hypothetical protein [Teredinibacter purpureus]|uniref:hypothetical protein n=1 Tax=Teredinibacter purpureus TaxID=2731756 RepID=UPI0005F7815A|nr:hypothetical protein [Teredinibacter purpureus]
MNNAEKALNILLAEFSEEKYASFVRKEVDSFERGDKKDIGFQSEGDDVFIEINESVCTIKFDFWDEKSNDFIQGEEDLKVDVVIRKIRGRIGF